MREGENETKRRDRDEERRREGKRDRWKVYWKDGELIKRINNVTKPRGRGEERIAILFQRLRTADISCVACTLHPLRPIPFPFHYSLSDLSRSTRCSVTFLSFFSLLLPPLLVTIAFFFYSSSYFLTSDSTRFASSPLRSLEATLIFCVRIARLLAFLLLFLPLLPPSLSLDQADAPEN